jgi:hypothetical protein
MPAADAPLRGTMRTVFAVGTAEGREWEVFGTVGDVAFDAAENLYVLDRPNKRVVVFDSAGRFDALQKRFAEIREREAQRKPERNRSQLDASSISEQGDLRTVDRPGLRDGILRPPHQIGGAYPDRVRDGGQRPYRG